MHKLYDLLKQSGIDYLSLPDMTIQDLKIDSREISVGDLFIAINGHNVDGRTFIIDAIRNGAVAVLSESESNIEKINYYDGVPVIHAPHLHKKLSRLSSDFYDNPSQKMTVIGVTGTNGKTTITQLIAQWTQLLGQRSAVMGTLGNGLLPALAPAQNTTASSVDIQRILSSFVTKNVDTVAMEVSSHGLQEERIRALDFDTVVFSNLSRDHLDYHGTMEAYEAAKWLLFSTHTSTHQVINADDHVGKRWLEKLPHAVAVSTGNRDLTHYEKWVKAVKISYHQQGTTIDVESSWGNGRFTSNLIGEFNVSNVLLALASLLILGFSFEQLLQTIKQIQAVAGRMELFQQPRKPTVIVDYAHTPDALEKALEAARQHCSGSVWCIFGCGGDRDSGKRPLMGGIAEQYADHIIITNDNPRTEDPQVIINNIKRGLLNPSSAQVIPDRKAAINSAITAASDKDVIIIAGKGHEDYQIINRSHLHFSDREIVVSLLGI